MKLLNTIVLSFFISIILIQSVSAVEYDTFTLSIMDLIKIAVALVGLIIILFTFMAFFAGGPSFLRLIVMMFYIGVTLLIVIIFIPIIINFISTTIG